MAGKYCLCAQTNSCDLIGEDNTLICMKDLGDPWPRHNIHSRESVNLFVVRDVVKIGVLRVPDNSMLLLLRLQYWAAYCRALFL